MYLRVREGVTEAYEKAKRGAESADLEYQQRRPLEEPRGVQFESVLDERMVCLREGKSDEQDPGDDPERDFTTGSPGEDAPAETDGHDKRAHEAGEEDDAEPVGLLQALLGRDVGLEVDSGEEEEDGWGDEGADDEVDVETLDRIGLVVGGCLGDGFVGTHRQVALLSAKPPPTYSPLEGRYLEEVVRY